MKERIEIKLFVLQAVHACDGEPIPRAALIEQTRIALAHRRLEPADIEAMLDSMTSQRLVAETEDPVTESKLYTLTPRGQAAYNSHLG